MRIARARHAVELPCRFLLVAAANPCPCGRGEDSGDCAASRRRCARYEAKLSGALADRIDIVDRGRAAPARGRSPAGRAIGGRPRAGARGARAPGARARRRARNARARGRARSSSAARSSARLRRWPGHARGGSAAGGTSGCCGSRGRSPTSRAPSAIAGRARRRGAVAAAARGRERRRGRVWTLERGEPTSYPAALRDLDRARAGRGSTGAATASAGRAARREHGRDHRRRAPGELLRAAGRGGAGARCSPAPGSSWSAGWPAGSTPPPTAARSPAAGRRSRSSAAGRTSPIRAEQPRLYERIVERGAVISELPPGTRPRARIISRSATGSWPRSAR